MKTEARNALPLLSCAMCAALCACAGSAIARSVSPLPAALPVTAANGAHKTTLSVQIVVPKRPPANSRNPAYVSAGTQSVAVTVTPSGGIATAPQLISCTAGTCSGVVDASPGNVTVTVKLYDQPNGAGNILSTGTAAVRAGTNTTTNVNLTFNPIVSTFTFAASGSFTAGTGGTVGVSAVAYDPDGYTIVGPGSYVDSSGNPVTITLTGLNEIGGDSTMSLSGNMAFTGPSSTAATLTYNGNSSYSATFTGASSPSRGMIASTPVKVSGYAINSYATLTAGSQPWGMVLGPDGNVWFTENAGPNIAKIATTGAITEYAITAGSSPSDIAVGPDGKLWFTEQYGGGGAGKIGRITTNGTGFVDFAAHAGAIPAGIVAGPDGNLWFTDAGNNSIGVMSTTGVMLHNYTAGITAGAFSSEVTPSTIVVGPDNNLWFSEVNNNKLARITTAGTVTEFALPGGTGIIGVGPDRNIWNLSAGAVVTLTDMSGAIVSTLGNPGDAILSSALMSGFAVGKDGNVWITDYNNQLVYRMTASNVVTLFSNGVTSGAGPDAMVIGADGNVWFNESVTSKIDRLVYGS